MLQEQAMQAVDAATLGLGFHKFDGTVPASEVIRQIGADFQVEKQHLVRIPNDVYAALKNGDDEPIMVRPRDLIETHCATVNSNSNTTIGVVGADYGIIQNQQAFDILDVLTSPDGRDSGLKIVSAGLVHDHEPYLQIALPNDGLNIYNDTSETEFYAFVHTSHDGSSQLKVSFSAIRVVCQNTFMANMKAIGFAFRHSSRVQERVDMSREANIERVRELVARTQVFKKDYVDRMNYLSSVNVNGKQVDDFISELFIEDKSVLNLYRRDKVAAADKMSSRLKNSMEAFRQTLEDGVGQRSARGTRLWLFNGLTNFYSNRQRYGSDKDDVKTRATKRFDSLNGGIASRRMEAGLRMLQEV